MAGVPILKIYRDWKDKRPERPIFRTMCPGSWIRMQRTFWKCRCTTVPPT